MKRKLHIKESNSLRVGDSVRFIHAGGRLSPETAKILNIDSDGFCKLRWDDGEISTGVDPHFLLHTGVEADSYEDEFGEDDDWYADYPDGYYESKKVTKNKKRIKESNIVKESIEDFNGYEFDPESSWTSIWNDVIQPIIDDEFNYNPGIESNIEDDIEAKITIFEDEFGYYPNVKLACDKFWRG